MSKPIQEKTLPPINGRGLTNIFESHCHYDDAAYESDADTVIRAAHENGVSRFINIGCDLASSKAGLKLTERYPYFFCTVGIHPEFAERELCTLQETLAQFKTLAARDKVVAIGEIGLDYHYEDGASKEAQKIVFEQQLILARELDMPVVIHSRDAVADTLALLQQYRPKGVVHCFSGAPEVAKQILDLGMYIGFTGVLTFQNAKKAVSSAAIIPNDRFLLETDCPYMAPVPFRGKRCQSDMIAHTAEKMAEIKGISAQQAVDFACQNTIRLFGLTI